MVRQENKKLLDARIKSLSTWMIIIGVLHIVASGFLSFYWGFVLIAFGLFSLIYRKMFVFLIFGILILIAGLSNLFSALIEIAYSGNGFNYFWMIFGGFQIWWGINEIIRYRKMRNQRR